MPKKIILGPFAPNLYTRIQSSGWSKFSIKKVYSFLHEIKNKMRVFLLKSDKQLPSYAPKTILGPFAPNSHTRLQSPCGTKFLKTKNWQSVGYKILNKMRGVSWGILPSTNLVDCADNCYTSLIFLSSFFSIFHPIFHLLCSSFCFL